MKVTLSNLYVNGNGITISNATGSFDNWELERDLFVSGSAYAFKKESKIDILKLIATPKASLAIMMTSTNSEDRELAQLIMQVRQQLVDDLKESL